MKLLEVTNRLAQTKKKLPEGAGFDILLEKVYYQLIEHLDDKRVTSLDDIVQAVYLIEKYKDDGLD